MDRRLAAAAALVAGLVVLADCGAAGRLSDEPATPTPAARFVAAPGLDAGGVADVERPVLAARLGRHRHAGARFAAAVAVISWPRGR